MLQSQRNRDGEAVHQTAVCRAFFMHVDKNLAQSTVFVFTGSKINLVPANGGLLGIPFSPMRQDFAPVLTDHFNDLFGDLHGRGFIFHLQLVKTFNRHTV